MCEVPLRESDFFLNTPTRMRTNSPVPTWCNACVLHLDTQLPYRWVESGHRGSGRDRCTQRSDGNIRPSPMKTEAVMKALLVESSEEHKVDDQFRTLHQNVGKRGAKRKAPRKLKRKKEKGMLPKGPQSPPGHRRWV